MPNNYASVVYVKFKQIKMLISGGRYHGPQSARMGFVGDSDFAPGWSPSGSDGWLQVRPTLEQYLIIMRRTQFKVYKTCHKKPGRNVPVEYSR